MSALEDIPRLNSEGTTAALRFCGEQFESIRSDLTELASGLDQTQLAWQPNASTWSIAQCIEHLSAAIELELDRLAMLITLADSARRVRRGPWRPGSSAPIVVMHESGHHVASPDSTGRMTQPETDPSTTVARFLDLNERLLRIIARGTRLAPFAAPDHSGSILLDLVGHTLQLNALHHWRFLLQARRLTERPGFPHHHH